jgi:hypothetical protein
MATNLLDIILSFGFFFFFFFFFFFIFFYKNFPKNFLFCYALGTPLDFIIIYCHFKNTLNKATNWFHSIFYFIF